MKRRIFPCNTVPFLINGLILIVIFTLSKFSDAAYYWDNSNSIFDGKATGIIRDILYREDGIWLGAENGIFVLRGNITEKISLPVQSNGYISDLESSYGSGVWVSIYADGLYKLTRRNKWNKLDIDPRLKDSWRVLEFDNYLAVLTIGSLLIIDKETYRVVKSIKGFTDRDFDEIPYVSKIDDLLVVIEKNRLLLVSMRSTALEISEYQIEDLWPDLSSVSMVKEHKNKYYIAGPEGLYIGSALFDSKNFYESKQRITNPISIAEKNDSIFLIANQILEIKNNSLYNVTWDGWLWNSQKVGFLTGFAETIYEDFLLTSSRKGLIYTPTYFDAINLSRELNFLENQLIKKNNFAGKVKSKLYRQQIQRACEKVLDEKSKLSRFLCKEDIQLLIPYVDQKWLVLYGHNNNQKLVVKDEALDDIESFELPSTVVDVAVDPEGQIYLLTSENRIYSQLSKFVWKDIEVTIPHSSNFTCFLASGDNGLYVCSSSSGVWHITKSEAELSKISVGGNSNIRYIRAGAIDSNGVLWLATNSGLFYYDSNYSYWQELSSSDGIKDVDFEYFGIAIIDNKTLIKGDNFDYAIQSDTFKLREEKRRRRQTHVQIEVRNEATGNLISLDETKKFYAVKKGRDILNIVAFTNDYINKLDLGIEYVVDKTTNTWELINSPNADINFPKLSPGEHTIHLRVSDPRSQAEQPVTTVKIRVLPPWWQSWQALLSFSVIVAFFSWLIYLNYQRRVREQAIYLSELVDEKNHVLSQTHDSLKQMLIRKQKQFTNLSHELRTPLSLILGPIAQIKEMITSPEVIEKADLIERNARNIEDILTEMMEIEKFEKNQEISHSEYDAKADCSRLLFDMVALAELKGKKLKWKCDTKIKIVLRAGTLERIISNLVSNAIKYTSSKGNIEVRIFEKDLHLCILVKDDGRGMSEQQVARMYQRYVRFGEDGKGSGVGLALVKEVVLANDGWINVSTAIDKGTTFCVFLPALTMKNRNVRRELLKKVAIREPEVKDYDGLDNKDNKDNKDNEDNEDTSKPVVLIVDDNEEMRLYLQSMLSDRYKCLLAENGQHALEITAHIVPDLVIADYKMPVMDGTDLTKALRNNDLTSHIPIIMLSGLSDSDSEIEGLEASIDNYVTKPVHADILRLRIRNLIDRNRSLRSKDATETQHEACQMVPDHVTERNQKFYFAVLNELELHYSEERFTKLQLAKNLAISERQLHRKISDVFGTGFSDLIRDFRLRKAKEMLIAGKQITRVVYDSGFSTPSYFSCCFKENTGLTPTEYQKANHKPKLQPVKHPLRNRQS